MEAKALYRSAGFPFLRHFLVLRRFNKTMLIVLTFVLYTSIVKNK